MARIGLSIAVCAIVVVSVVSATVVTIAGTNYAEKGGFFVSPYFEFLNAPVTGCASPCLTVDTQTSVPNPTKGTLSLDGSATGVWTSGASFTITATTANPNDVIVIWAVTYKSGSSITVSSLSDSLGKVTWQSSARSTYTSCTGTQETTQTEWYGTASTAVSSDVITASLSGIPTSAAGEEFAVTGANTASPFDPNVNVPKTGLSTCTGTAATPSVSGLSTTNNNDFLFALYGGYTSTTETAGVGGTLIRTVAGTGDSLAGEYAIVPTTLSAITCSFGTSTTYWGIFCDAIVQGAGSFSLPAASTMYLWSPQIGTSSSIQAGALSLQLFADLPAPALDGSSSGTWVAGNTFTIASFSTAQTNDVVVLSIQTYLSGSTVTVSSVSDTQGKVTWQSLARNTLTSCSGTQRSTNIEWYGTAATAITGDTVTVTMSATPTAASGMAFGISGADTTTPFDPAAGIPKTGVSTCTATAAVPTVSGVSTVADNDFMYALYGGYTSTTETAGTIAGGAASIARTVAGTGDSNAVETLVVATAQSGASCTFGTSTTFWSALCDAVMPARQTVTISFVTTNSAGTVQSSMISGSSATITAAYAPISLSSSAGTVPASGYIRVAITAPAGTGLTIFWGYGKPTQFQVSYTYRTS